MKLSAAIALAAVGGASAYSVNRSTLRSLGQKNVAATSQRNVRTNDIKMEGERILCVVLLSFSLYRHEQITHHYYSSLQTSVSSRDPESVSRMPGLVPMHLMHASPRLVSRGHSTRMVFVTR